MWVPDRMNRFIEYSQVVITTQLLTFLIEITPGLIYTVCFWYSTISVSWQRIYRTGIIKVSIKYTLLVSLHYTTHKVFKSHTNSSPADYFNCSRRILKHFSAVLPELHYTDYWLTLTDTCHSLLVAPSLTSMAPALTSHYTACTKSRTNLSLPYAVSNTITVFCLVGSLIQSPKRSKRTRRKHRLRHLFYCRVTYTS
jgi:hypothetical protein